MKVWGGLSACLLGLSLVMRSGPVRASSAAFLASRRYHRPRTRSRASASSGAVEGPNPFGLDGLLALYKPEGWTSNDVVQKVRAVMEKTVRHRLGGKYAIKVGHGGTLDPMATGVLVLGVGAGCKTMGEFLKGSKGYTAEGKLGEEYDTGDCTGQVLEEVDPSHVTLESLEAALPAFRGTIMQKPPAFSAVKRGGRKLYELARKGETVEVEARPVQVDKLELTGGLELPAFGLVIECGGGTYVRSLIADIGRALDTRAHMTALVRTQQGPFKLEHCLPEERWTDFDALVQHVQYCNRVVE